MREWAQDRAQRCNCTLRQRSVVRRDAPATCTSSASTAGAGRWGDSATVPAHGVRTTAGGDRTLLRSRTAPTPRSSLRAYLLSLGRRCVDRATPASGSFAAASSGWTMLLMGRDVEVTTLRTGQSACCCE